MTVPQTAPIAISRRRVAPAVAASIRELWRCDAKALFTALMRQRMSFLFLCLYVVIEYVRPQQIYPSLNFMPWGKVSLIGTILFFLFEGGSLRVKSVANWGMLAYTAIVVLSIGVAYLPMQSIQNLDKWYYWVVIYFVIINIVTTEERYLMFLVAYFVCNLKMSQGGFRSFMMDGFHFRDWGVAGGPGWFQNSGEFGVEMSVFFPMSFYFFISLWKKMSTLMKAIYFFMPFSAVFVIIGTSSRGAQLALAASLLWMVGKSKYKMRTLVACAVILPTLWTFLPAGQIKRFQEAGTDETSLSRLTLWRNGRQIIREHPVLGIGFDNWLSYYRSHIGRGAQLAHNIFIECAAELGLLGGAVLVALILITFYINYRTRVLAKPLGDDGRLYWNMAHGMDAALIGFLVSGFFVTVLYYPFMWFNLAFTVVLQTATMAAVQRVHGVRRQPTPVPRPVAGRLQGRRPVRATAFVRPTP